MAYWQENHAPEGCTNPICVHLEIMTFNKERHDRCKLKKPMHDNCAWFKSVDELKKETKGGLQTK